jgi:hypothetical protein
VATISTGTPTVPAPTGISTRATSTPVTGATIGGGPTTVTDVPSNVSTLKFTNALTGANRDAFVALNSLFTSYGLASLAPKIFSYIQNGYSADTISLLLQDTTEYKTRFAGNDLRAKNGLAVLSPADYLATEASYRQVMSSAGLPASFYDSPSDYANWIGSDVSPTEIKSRVDLATVATTAADPYLKQQLAAFYGVDDAHLTAYFLDQSKALPLLQKQEAAAQFGAEAARRGLLSDANSMMDYVNQGFSQSQASQGFQQVAEELPNLQALAARFGTTFSQSEEESTVFGTSADSTDKKKGLASQERAMFSGSSGAAGAGLSAGYRAT